MLKRLVEQRKAVRAANAEANESFDLTPFQWNLAEKVIKLLQSFEEATEDISNETFRWLCLFQLLIHSVSCSKLMKRIMVSWS